MFRPALYFPKREMSMWPTRKRGKSVRAIQAELGSARLCRRGAREAGCRSWRADLGFKMVGNARGSANTTRTSVFVYNHAYGVLAGEAGRFSLVGDYTTNTKTPTRLSWGFFLGDRAYCPVLLRATAESCGPRPPHLLACSAPGSLSFDHFSLRPSCPRTGPSPQEPLP